jgi:hypothetical protein
MQNVARFGRMTWMAMRKAFLVSVAWVADRLSSARRRQNRALTKGERKQLRKQQVREALAGRRPGRKGLAKAA